MYVKKISLPVLKAMAWVHASLNVILYFAILNVSDFLTSTLKRRREFLKDMLDHLFKLAHSLCSLAVGLPVWMCQFSEANSILAIR